MKGLSVYLEWREAIFRSAAGDTSLIEIMPRWMPKSVRRLLQLAVQVVQFCKIRVDPVISFHFSLAYSCRRMSI